MPRISSSGDDDDERLRDSISALQARFDRLKLVKADLEARLEEQTREIEERKRENAELALKHKERLEQEEKKQDDARERLEKIKEETKSVRETHMKMQRGILDLQKKKHKMGVAKHRLNDDGNQRASDNARIVTELRNQSNALGGGNAVMHHPRSSTRSNEPNRMNKSSQNTPPGKSREPKPADRTRHVKNTLLEFFNVTY